MIRSATPSDALSICGIYNHYVEKTWVTFETEAVTVAEMTERIASALTVLPWLVWEEKGEVIGYAYASKWKGRAAYRYSVESTIYLRHDAGRRGIGSQLYAALIGELQKLGIHCVIGGIALPNAASQRLHEKFGFKKVAHFEQVGWKFDRWIDVGYWERILPSSP